MTEHDYDKWNYWLAYYTDGVQGGYAMARTPLNVKMIDMMQHFIKKQPQMDFTPNRMYLGRAVDSVKARVWYDKNDYVEFTSAILNYDRSVITDVCITELVRAKSLSEFEAFKLANPRGITFDSGNLDEVIKSSKKKKKH